MEGKIKKDGNLEIKRTGRGYIPQCCPYDGPRPIPGEFGEQRNGLR